MEVKDKEDNGLADAIETNRNKVVLLRTRQPPKCTKILEDILQLRIDAVLKAKVDLKLPGSLSTQEKEIEKNAEKETEMDLMEESDADNSTIICNEPDDEETVSCRKKVKRMVDISEAVTTAVSAKESEKRNAIIQLFLN